MAAFAITFKSQNSRTRDRRWSAENLVIWIIVTGDCTALSLPPRLFLSKVENEISFFNCSCDFSLSEEGMDGFGDGDKWLRRFLFLLGFEGLQD